MRCDVTGAPYEALFSFLSADYRAITAIEMALRWRGKHWNCPLVYFVFVVLIERRCARLTSQSISHKRREFV